MNNISELNPTQWYLILSAFLFLIGALGVLIRRNIIVILMCIELMLNAVNLTLVALAQGFGSVDGQIYVFFVMAVAAAEVSVGLAIVLCVFKNYLSTNEQDVQLLRG